jgi:ubiquinone/menaquinone biosynthesis C-methylase UbiE
MRLDPAYRRNAAKMLEHVVRDGDRVLDVGMGTGVLAELCSERVREYVGLDYSGAMLSKAVKKASKNRLSNVVVRWGSARSLPYREDTFDAVVSSFMLPHFAPSEKPEVVEEMARVLKPGRRLGLFLAQGEVYPMFATRDQIEQYLAETGLEQTLIEETDDIYRIVVARKPRSW